MKPSKSVSQFEWLFTEDNHSATALHLACIHCYGVEYLDWEVDTVELEILDDLGKKEEDLDPGVFDRLHALNVALSTELYYTYLESFENITKALSFEEPNFRALTPCTPAEITWAVYEVRFNDSTPGTYSGEVQAYMREALHYAGYYRAPKELAFCRYGEHYDASWVFDTEVGATAKLMDQGQQRLVSEYMDLRIKNLEEELTRMGVRLELGVSP